MHRRPCLMNPSDAPSHGPRSPGDRALALDALRGLAILLMCLSSVIPWGVLPRWMYHAQVPPPHHVFDPSIPGITWVDLVFPFFLFAMGAAIPLALSRRIERGAPMPRIVAGVLLRGVFLLAFGVYIHHIKPTVLSKSPTVSTWLLSLLGFALLFPMLTRLPRKWTSRLRVSIRAAGFAGAVILLAFLRYPDGTGFRLVRNDIIIIVLGDMSVLGAFIWLATRERILARFGVLAVVAALRLSAAEPGWVRAFAGGVSIPQFFELHFTKYLFLIVPGTVVGDAVLRWLRARTHDEDRPLTVREGILASLCLAILAGCLVGLYARWVPATFVGCIAACALAVFLTRPSPPTCRTSVSDVSSPVWRTPACLDGAVSRWRVRRRIPDVPGYGNSITHLPVSPAAELLRSLILLASAWLLLGLILEPFEGGIRKDHATLSYPFVTGGLAIFLLVAFLIAIDLRAGKARGFGLLIATGQNPLLAYAAIPALLPPVLNLTGLGPRLTELTLPLGPWVGALRGLVMTIVLALVVAWFTRRRVQWRA